MGAERDVTLVLSLNGLSRSIGEYAEFNRSAFLRDSRIVLETKGAFRVTHEMHDVSFYPSLLIDKQQGQMMHHALHA